MKSKLNLYSDIVICGAGASGLAAALTASYGDAKIVVFEKTGVSGGISVFAEGLFGIGSALQSEKQIDISKNDVFKNHMQYSHWSSNPRLVKNFIDRSGDTIDWLNDEGVEFDGPTEYFPNGPQVFHWIRGGGSKLIKKLSEKLNRRGVPIYYETAAKKLTCNQDGAITGVIVKGKDGKNIRVNSKVVIISTGDFADNLDMLENFTDSGARAINRIRGMGRTGDGIKMAWEVGAAPEGTNVLLASPWVPGEGRGSYLKAMASKPHLWINLQGERFCAEDLSFPFAGNALASQEEGSMWVIFDESIKIRMLKAGIRYRFGAFSFTDINRFNDEFDRGIKDGKAVVADSIENLAEKIGLKYGVFQKTVDDYNRCCAQHHDDIFAKGPEYLQPIRKSPFYGIKSCFHLTATLGGIKINHRAEVISVNHRVIPGLYAAGSCAGGLYGKSYDVSHTTGGALGFAINSGRMAAENALDYL